VTKIRVNLHHGKIEDAVVRAVIEHTDGLKLQVDFGHEQTALIEEVAGCRVRSSRRVCPFPACSSWKQQKLPQYPTLAFLIAFEVRKGCVCGQAKAAPLPLKTPFSDER